MKNILFLGKAFYLVKLDSEGGEEVGEGGRELRRDTQPLLQTTQALQTFKDSIL